MEKIKASELKMSQRFYYKGEEHETLNTIDKQDWITAVPLADGKDETVDIDQWEEVEVNAQ